MHALLMSGGCLSHLVALASELSAGRLARNLGSQ